MPSDGTVFVIILGLVSTFISYAVNCYVPEPYMVGSMMNASLRLPLPLLSLSLWSSPLFTRLAIQNCIFLSQDEIFHIPQTKRYCLADWQTWDPKITTFPGSYIVGALAAWVCSGVYSLVQSSTFSTIDAVLRDPHMLVAILRSTSTILWIGSLFLFRRLYDLLTVKPSEQRSALPIRPRASALQGFDLVGFTFIPSFDVLLLNFARFLQ